MNVAIPSDACWKVGVELELMAPPGGSRRDLSDAIAGSCNGTVRRVFKAQSEFSKLEDVPVFENLMLGFAIEDADGEPIAQCVDDLTLLDDLDAAASPSSGWYRILSDDMRLLGLVERTCDATADIAGVLAPLAAVFGTEVEDVEGEGIFRVCDQRGVSVAMAVPLPGERQRPCELVTAPLTTDREARLTLFLGLARELGFSVPAEAATHIHFDGACLQSAPAIRTLVDVFGTYRNDLRRLLKTNARCRRLGDWPKALGTAVCQPEFRRLSWPDARARLRESGVRKYCDFNIVNLLADQTNAATFEIRILPGMMAADEVLRAIRLFESLLHYVIEAASGPTAKHPPLMDLVARLDLSEADQKHWQAAWTETTPRRRFGF